MLFALASNTGCCLLHELWYALPGAHGCRLYKLGCCVDKCGACEGCGEKYWGEISDPPAPVGCGPCDQCARWHGYPKYPGYTPYGHHGSMHHGSLHHGHMHEVYHEGHMSPEVIHSPSPTPAPPPPPTRPQARSGQPTRTVRSTHNGSMAATPVKVIGRAPTDEEMQLPPGAKIIDRTDRVVGESSVAPVNTRTASQVSRSAPQRASRTRPASHQEQTPVRHR